jgi:hypothetical protein
VVGLSLIFGRMTRTGPSEWPPRAPAAPLHRSASAIRVYLTSAEYQALGELAEQEDRSSQAQAARFIREGLRAAGVLESEGEAV